MQSAKKFLEPVSLITLLLLSSSPLSGCRSGNAARETGEPAVPIVKQIFKGAVREGEEGIGEKVAKEAIEVPAVPEAAIAAANTTIKESAETAAERTLQAIKVEIIGTVCDSGNFEQVSAQLYDAAYRTHLTSFTVIK